MYTNMTILRDRCDEIIAEYINAREKHDPMHSAHEGYAVILEELDELKFEVWRKSPNKEHLRKEAIQIAAMALAFIMEVCDKP